MSGIMCRSGPRDLYFDGPLQPTLRDRHARRPHHSRRPGRASHELVRRWNERQHVEDDPDCYELNEFGEWIVSPRPTHGHQQVASVVAFQLTTQLGERAVIEVSVYTDRGIRAPDVVWTPATRWLEAKGQNPLAFVPDVCVEVLSPSNTRQEILIEVGAYLRGGAREAIVVGLKGQLEFFGPGGRLEASALGIRLSCRPSCSSSVSGAAARRARDFLRASAAPGRTEGKGRLAPSHPPGETGATRFCGSPGPLFPRGLSGAPARVPGESGGAYETCHSLMA